MLFAFLRCTYAGGERATVAENQPSVLGKAKEQRTAGKAQSREHYWKYLIFTCLNL